MRIRQAFLVNTSPVGFRPGVQAEILGVKLVTPFGCSERPCFYVRYADGQEDLVAICDDTAYTIIPNMEAHR